MSTMITNGGPAFPESKGAGNVWVSKGGMTLRDYFAAKAMQAWVSDPSFRDTEEHIDRAVSISYRIADAMLKEREVSND